MNIREVARQAQVSTATVSRVINRSAPVSEEVTERVKSIIEKLNFYPNTHARTLGSGKSRIYGLIISDITNPFFPELVKSFEDVAVAHGKEVIVANTDYQLKRTEICVRRMLERKVDAVAIMTSEMEPDLVDVLDHHRIPIVFLDTGSVGERSSNIELDYAGGIDAAVGHLAELGHTRIAFISNSSRWKSGEIRSEAFRAAMRRRNLAYVPERVPSGTGQAAGGRIAMAELLKLTDPPTAVLGANDLTAIGALDAIYEAGLRVPQDISLIGFDDIALSSYTHPPLTTVRISRDELATRAFNALYAVSEQGEAGSAQKIGVSLMVRQSTARVPESVAGESER